MVIAGLAFGSSPLALVVVVDVVDVVVVVVVVVVDVVHSLRLVRNPAPAVGLEQLERGPRLLKAHQQTRDPFLEERHVAL